MLVLSRQVEEVIVIGQLGEIKVKVLGVTGTQVRLGITAPNNLTVHRQEIYQRIKENERVSKENK